MTSQGYQQMAGVERAVAEQRRKNVHRYQSEPVVPLPEPGEQNSEAFKVNFPKEEQKATNRLGNRLVGVSLLELFTVAYTTYFVSPCCCFSCTLCAAELNDCMEHTGRKKS